HVPLPRLGVFGPPAALHREVQRGASPARPGRAAGAGQDLSLTATLSVAPLIPGEPHSREQPARPDPARLQLADFYRLAGLASRCRPCGLGGPLLWRGLLTGPQQGSAPYDEWQRSDQPGSRWSPAGRWHSARGVP